MSPIFRQCKLGEIVEISEGQSVSLTSQVDAQTRCNLLFTQRYGKDNVNLTSKTAWSCNFLIESATKADAGLYRVVDIDGQPITKCHLSVMELGGLPWMMASFAIFTMLMVTIAILWKLLSRASEKYPSTKAVVKGEEDKVDEADVESNRTSKK